MVRVPIHDQNPLHSGFHLGCPGAQSDIVDKAVSTALPPACMVARWPHQSHPSAHLPLKYSFEKGQAGPGTEKSRGPTCSVEVHRVAQSCRSLLELLLRHVGR